MIWDLLQPRLGLFFQMLQENFLRLWEGNITWDKDLPTRKTFGFIVADIQQFGGMIRVGSGALEFMKNLEEI